MPPDTEELLNEEDTEETGNLPDVSLKGILWRGRPAPVPEKQAEEPDSFFISGAVPKNAIEELSKKYGVSKEDLIVHAYLRGGTVEGESRPLLYAGALAGEVLPISGGAAAAYAQKKNQPEEKRAAFDELANIVDEKRAVGRTIGELALGLATPLAVGAKVKAVKRLGELAVKEAPELIAKKIGAESSLAKRGISALTVGTEGAGLGAASGVIQSEEGEELTSAAIGGAMGAALGSTLGAIAAPAAKGVAPELAEKTFGELAQEASESTGKLAKIVDEAVEANRERDDALLNLMEKIVIPEDSARRYNQRKAVNNFETSAGDDVAAKAAIKDAIDSLPTDEKVKTLQVIVKERLIAPSRWEEIASRTQEALPQASSAELQEALATNLIYEGILPQIAKFTNDALSGAGPALTKRNPTLALERLATIKQGIGGIGLRDKFNGYRKVLAASDVNVMKKALDEGVNDELSELSMKYDRGINPARYVADKIDRRLGTSFVEKVDAFSRNLNFYKTAVAQMQPLVKRSYDAISTAAKRVGVPLDEANSILYKRLDGQDLTKREADIINRMGPEVVTLVQDNFEKFRNIANQFFGEEVIKKWGGETGSYIYHAAVDFKTAVKRILDATEELAQHPEMKRGNILGEMPLDDALRKLNGTDAGKKLEQLKDATEFLTGKKFKQVDQLFRGLELLKGRQASKALGDFNARSSVARIGENIPSLIRERDIMRLQDRWLMTNLKAAALAAPARSMLADVKMLKKLSGKQMAQLAEKEGAEVSPYYAHAADYFGKLIQDLQFGSREKTLIKALDQFNKAAQISLLQQAKQAKSKTGRFLLSTAAEYPEIIQFMTSQMYPAVLSVIVNPVSALVNFTQPLMYTVPELGGAYGTKKWLKSMYNLSRATKDIMKEGKAFPIFDEMYSRGYMGAEWSGELLDAANEATSGIRNEFARKFGTSVNKMNQVLMWPFSRAEFLNRAAAFMMGKDVAADMIGAISKRGKDLTGNEQAALKFFQELPAAYKKRISKEMRRIGPKGASKESSRAIEDSVISHLIGKTIFNYDKASASQIAREIAPVLMTFTKFPLNVMGDAVDTMARKGVWKGGQDLGNRFLLPHMGLLAMDEILKGLSDSDQLTLEQALDGDDPIGTLRFLATGGSKAGLKRYSMAGSIGGMLTGEWASPPGLAPIAAGGSLLTGDWQEAKKSAKDAFKFLMPAPFTNSIFLYDKLVDAGVAPELIED